MKIIRKLASVSASVGKTSTFADLCDRTTIKTTFQDLATFAARKSSCPRDGLIAAIMPDA